MKVLRWPILFALIICAAGAAVWLYNNLLLQRPLEQALSVDSRNVGVQVAVHFQHYTNPRVVVFDLRNVAGTNSRLDVFRILLIFAKQEQSRQFDSVELDCRGRPRLWMRGDYFQELGREYETANPIQTSLALPAHVYDANGRALYAPPDEGLYGLAAGLQHFSAFMDRWCFRDLAMSFHN
jgi:hypothetical protein